MYRPLVMVVDDDPDLRETLCDVLEQAGYPTVCAEHGLAALQLLRETRELPSVILLDLMMPVMDGKELVGELRKDPRLAELPFVVFTAHTDRDRAAASLQAAAALTKPLELDELLSVVASVAGR